MKKILVFICLIFSILALQGCKIKNQSKTFPDGFDISVGQELMEYMLYPDHLPVMHFDMPNVNVSTTSTNYKLVLVNNDFYKVSDAWEQNLKQNAKGYIILENLSQANESKYAKFGGDDLELDEFFEDGTKQESSKEIRLVTWTSSGTRYSYQFRTFVSNKKRYYAFCYSTPLVMALEQSLMVIKIDGKNKLLLIPLPYDTLYEVSGSNLTIDALIKKDTYLDPKFNTFLYPNALNNEPLEKKRISIMNWYEEFCNGLLVDDKFIIEYAGARFEVDFDASKEDGATGKMLDAFRLIYLGPIYE